MSSLEGVTSASAATGLLIWRPSPSGEAGSRARRASSAPRLEDLPEGIHKAVEISLDRGLQVAGMHLPHPETRLQHCKIAVDLILSVSLGPSDQKVLALQGHGEDDVLAEAEHATVTQGHLLHGVLQVQEGQMLSKEQGRSRSNMNMTDAKSSPIPADTV